jgi:hypothetical protein
MHSEELLYFYSSPNIGRITKSRRMIWDGNVVHMGETRSAYRVMLMKSEGKRPLRRWRPKSES